MKSFKEMAAEAQNQADMFEISDTYMKVVFSEITTEILELIDENHKSAFLLAVLELRKIKEDETTEN